MKYTVIIPVYNVENYLHKCLDSIVQQSFDDYEVLLIDDGSTDASGKICDEYEQKYAQVSVIHKKNEGVVSARKEGAIHAKGQYILSIDDDDFVAGDFLEIIDRELEITKDIDCIAWGYKRVDADGTILSEHKNMCDAGVYQGTELDRLRESWIYDGQMLGMNLGTVVYGIWCKCVKREIYVKAQMLVDSNVSRGEDVLLFSKIMNMIASIKVIDYTGYHYRITANSITQLYRESDWKAFLTLLYNLDKCGIGTDYLNRCKVYALRNIYQSLCYCYAANPQYVAFKKALKNVYLDQLIYYIKGVKVYQQTTKGKIKKLMIQKKMWFLMYCYQRICSHG